MPNDEPTKTTATRPRDAKWTRLKGFRKVILCFLKRGSSIGRGAEQRALSEARRLVIDVVLKKIKRPKPELAGQSTSWARLGGVVGSVDSLCFDAPYDDSNGPTSVDAWNPSRSSRIGRRMKGCTDSN